MLDQLKNLANLPQVLTRARELQDKMRQLQDELAARTVEADAGAGIVTATVNGRMELVRIRIDPQRLGLGQSDRMSLTPTDLEMVEDLTAAAVRAAQSKAAEMVREEMSRLTADLGLPPGLLPGM